MLSQRADWPTIEKQLATLKALYQKTHAKTSSIKYRIVHWIQNKEFVYGEIDFLSFFTILERVSPSSEDVFYDLGSGVGKAVCCAHLFFNVNSSIGIELLPPLYEQANRLLQKFRHKIDGRIQFINTNFLEYDFRNADILYVAATCLSDQTWNNLIGKMLNLKPGSRLIVSTRTINHERFKAVYQGIELMSWGLCLVSIYELTRLTEPNPKEI